MPVTTAEAQARMQAKLAELAAAGLRRVLLFGAGQHTLKVGPVLGDAPVEVLGVIDDARGGNGHRLWGWPVLSRDQAVQTDAEAVIISSDAGEQAIHDRHADWYRQHGKPLHRLYNTNDGQTRQVFVDADGREHALVPGYRRSVKPGWENMLRQTPGDYPPADLHAAKQALAAGQRRVALLEKYLQMHRQSIRNKSVLEIGCWDGACTAALVLGGAARATGIDHQDYFLWNVEPEAITDAQRAAARDSLAGLQAMTLRACHDAIDVSRIDLRIGDINACDLPDQSFDLICSWQTFEHVIPPSATFDTIAALLKPGGVCFAEYGAFTCRKGGHALVTLDFPWGHVRLSEADVDRYLDTLRPDEYEHAIRHYHRFLNRMTVADARQYAAQAGLNVLHVLPWLNRQHFEDELEPQHLSDARRHYPSMAIEDMVHDDVWLLLQKAG